MGDPRKVWQSVQPTIQPNGSCHILTTGQGPTNYASEYFRLREAGQGAHVPVFIGALARPDRDEAWLDRKQRELGRSHMRMEFPLSVEDALAGEGSIVFLGEDVDHAGVDFRPRTPNRDAGTRWLGTSAHSRTLRSGSCLTSPSH